MRKLTAQRILISLTAAAAFLTASCTQLKQPAPEPYFAETPAPPKQELRWSNGKAPKSLDPAKAAAAPETDIARALYEGLTDLDPRTLEAVPAAAEKWEASDENKTWRFYLREDAVWSNGKKVTAEDFVRSIKRLGELEAGAAHRALLVNFRGCPRPRRPMRRLPENSRRRARCRLLRRVRSSFHLRRPLPRPLPCPSAGSLLNPQALFG